MLVMMTVQMAKVRALVGYCPPPMFMVGMVIVQRVMTMID